MVEHKPHDGFEDVSIDEKPPIKDIENVDDDIDTHYARNFVKGIAPETDDPNSPSLTIRSAIIGIFFTILFALMNGIVSFRTNGFYANTTLITILSYPIGIFFSKAFPRGILNPGPFTIKEHVLVYIFGACAGLIPYGVENVFSLSWKDFMNDPNVNFYNSFGFILATQMIGFGLSGLLRRFLVHPPSMFWPSSLGSVTLFMSFHNDDDNEEIRDVGGLSRYSFFLVLFAASLVWAWVPTYSSNVFQSISLLCFVAGDNKFLRWFGSSHPNTGAGFLSISTDFTIMSTAVFTWPFYASCNQFIGMVFWGWIIAPILYYRKSFGGPDLQLKWKFDDGTSFGRAFNTPSLFDNTGKTVSAVKFYKTDDFSLNISAYNSYKPIYISERFALQFFISFAMLTAGVSHVALWYSKEIIEQTKGILSQKRVEHEDIHNKLMSAYPEIPDWMFLIWLAFWFAVMCVIGYITPFKIQLWAVFLGLFMGFFFLIPFGIIIGSTGLKMDLLIISQLVIGFIIPGQTVAAMTFKSFSHTIIVQSLSLILDLKIGHYMHINPVHLVIAQISGTFIGAISTTSAVFLVMKYFPLGTPDWKYNSHVTFFSHGAIWGAIGPERFFGSSSNYFSLNSGYLIGFVAPFLPWIGNKMIPSQNWRFIHFPIFFYIRPSGNTLSMATTGFILSLIFMHFVYKYRHAWWLKYNFLVPAAVDGGACISTIVAAIMTMINSSLKVPHGPWNPADFYDYYCLTSNWNNTQFSH